jgi:hypothetical protein
MVLSLRLPVPPGGERPAGSMATTRAADDRGTVLVETVAVAVVLIILYVSLRATNLLVVGAFDDDGAYAAIGAAIAGGKGYRLLHLVGEPVAVKYPPGLPALLSLAWLAGGTPGSVQTMVGVLHPVLCGFAAAGLWWLGRHWLGVARVPMAVLVVGPFLLDPAIEYYNIALSEPYFIAGWVAGLILSRRFSVAAPGQRPGTAIALGLTLSATALFRSAALLLIPSLLFALFLRGRRGRDFLLCSASAVLPLVGWRLFHAHLMAQGPLPDIPDETTYWGWLSVSHTSRFLPFMLKAISSNARAYVYHLAVLLSDRPLLGIVGVLLGMCALLVSVVRQLWAQPELVLTVVVSLLVVVFWPYAQDRLLLPVLPFAGLLVARDLQSALSRSSKGARTAVVVALGIAALLVAMRQQRLRSVSEQAGLIGGPVAAMNVSPRWFMLQRSTYITQLAGWVRTHTTMGDRLVVPFPGALFLYTGRKTIPAAPADPDFARSSFAVAGRYLATRILEDSGTVIAFPSAVFLVATDISTIQSRCPDLLRWAGEGAPGAFPAVYRIGPDRTCLRRFLADLDDRGQR